MNIPAISANDNTNLSCTAAFNTTAIAAGATTSVAYHVYQRYHEGKLTPTECCVEVTLVTAMSIATIGAAMLASAHYCTQPDLE